MVIKGVGKGGLPFDRNFFVLFRPYVPFIFAVTARGIKRSQKLNCICSYL